MYQNVKRTCRRRSRCCCRRRCLSSLVIPRIKSKRLRQSVTNAFYYVKTSPYSSAQKISFDGRSAQTLVSILNNAQVVAPLRFGLRVVYINYWQHVARKNLYFNSQRMRNAVRRQFQFVCFPFSTWLPTNSKSRLVSSLLLTTSKSWNCHWNIKYFFWERVPSSIN